jgi:hypothetical protein
MVCPRGAYLLAVLTFLLLLLHPLSGKTEEFPFDRALEGIYELDFEGAHGLLSGTLVRRSELEKQVEKARALKTIVSLSQTFSSLRLWAAYREAVEKYSQLATRESDVLRAFEGHRAHYAMEFRKWAHRLAEDTEAVLKGKLEVELSIKYKGLKDLPTFVQDGTDLLETVRKGLLPTPSQSRNIETSEGYASFLSSLALALGEPFYEPQTTTVITGRVKPVHLLYYCSFWLLNASPHVDNDKDLISASSKAALKGLELEREYPAPVLRGKLMEILGII